MKIDRLIGILAVLLQKEKVTAPYLANKFEVSRRTINRDIENLSKAGIPVVTTQGQNGGISIMKEYKIDKTLLTSKEMQAILAGLKSLDSVSATKQYKLLMEKLSGRSHLIDSGGEIIIDLSSWYKDSLTPKIENIQEAIDKNRLIEFLYFSPSRESKRTVEPYYLVFRWSSWYIWCYCLEKEDFRMFKLNRMEELAVTEKVFLPRENIDMPLSIHDVFHREIKIEAAFKQTMKWRLIEEYGKDSFTEMSDGRLLFAGDFNDKENLFSWILSFGINVEILKPQSIRDEFLDILDEMKKSYT